MNKLKFKIKNLILAIFGAFSLLLICITLLLQYNYSYSVVEKSTSSLIDRITINTTQQLHDFEDKMALEILKSAKEDKKTALLDGKEYLLSQSTLSSNFGLNHKIVLLSSKDAAFSDFNQAIIMEIAMFVLILLLFLPILIVVINSFISPIDKLIEQNNKIKDKR